MSLLLYRKRVSERTVCDRRFKPVGTFFLQYPQCHNFDLCDSSDPCAELELNEPVNFSQRTAVCDNSGICDFGQIKSVMTLVLLRTALYDIPDVYGVTQNHLRPWKFMPTSGESALAMSIAFARQPLEL